MVVVGRDGVGGYNPTELWLKETKRSDFCVLASVQMIEYFVWHVHKYLHLTHPNTSTVASQLLQKDKEKRKIPNLNVSILY